MTYPFGLCNVDTYDSLVENFQFTVYRKKQSERRDFMADKPYTVLVCNLEEDAIGAFNTKLHQKMDMDGFLYYQRYVKALQDTFPQKCLFSMGQQYKLNG